MAEEEDGDIVDSWEDLEDNGVCLVFLVDCTKCFSHLFIFFTYNPSFTEMSCLLSLLLPDAGNLFSLHYKTANSCLPP